MNTDLYNLNKNYVYGEQLVTVIDEFIGIIEVDGKEVTVLPSECICLGNKVKEFELAKQYIFDKRLIPTYLGMSLSGWENEIDGKPVKVVNEKNGYCFNDKGEAYIIFASWCVCVLEED